MTKSGFDLSEFRKKMEAVGERAIKVAQEVINDKSAEFENNLKKDCPVKTGGLKNSIVRTKCSNGSWYGYKVEFVGNAPNYEPYDKIANILNWGNERMAGTFFVNKNVSKLESIDKTIEARLDQLLNEQADLI
jgi:hypothetical protein